MKELSPLEIKNKIMNGEISQEQAIQLFKGTHQQTEVVPYVPRAKKINLAKVSAELFNHNNADLHYEQRMDLEEGIRHVVGMPIYGAIAAVDAVVDAASFGVTEIVEDATFLVSRTIYRAGDGWRRGQIK